MDIALKKSVSQDGKMKACIALNAEKGHGIYICPECGQPVYKRVGEYTSAHFAHERDTSCNGGKYGEYHKMTDWHQKWQSRFPEECREIFVKDPLSNRYRRADVLIDKTVVEFQHSNISREELLNRSDFWLSNGYRIIWLFDLTNTYLTPNRYDDSFWYEWEDPFDALKGYTKADNDNGITIFLENHINTTAYEVWERGFDIIKPMRIVGNKYDNTVKIFYDKNNLDCLYDKDRFVSFCGLKLNLEGKHVSDFRNKYKTSKKIALYNYVTNESVFLKEEPFINFDSNWLMIYRSLTVEEQKNIEDRRKEEEERNRRFRENSINEIKTSVVNDLNAINEAYKKRYEAKMSDSVATNNSVRNIITKIRRDIYNSIWNFHIGNELEEYSRNLDGYYLALLRNLPEIAEMRKRDADMYYNAIVEAIESHK